MYDRGTALSHVVESLAPMSERLTSHPLYTAIKDLRDVRRFMEVHVFSVWDFMCLLKALQRDLTCVDPVWLPNGDNSTRRMINEIVLGEESDETMDRQGAVSHFELYLEAMEACGADTGPVRSFLGEIRETGAWPKDLDRHGVPKAAQRFLADTRRTLAEGKLHKTAASFTFGRENIIPDMFTAIVAEIDKETQNLGIFVYYLNRHIELDGDEHGPLAHRMIATLCGDDAEKWREAGQAARSALEARLALWDDVYASLHLQEISPVQAA